MSFKSDFKTEWARLNPIYRKPTDTLLETFVAAFREGLRGYFAPLRILWWLIRYTANRLSRREPGA